MILHFNDSKGGSPAGAASSCPVTDATETELLTAKESLDQLISSGWGPSLFKVPEDGGIIDELAKIIGVAPTLAMKRNATKLGLRMSVQIMIRVALKMGVIAGLIIADQRKKKVV